MIDKHNSKISNKRQKSDILKINNNSESEDDENENPKKIAINNFIKRNKKIKLEESKRQKFKDKNISSKIELNNISLHLGNRDEEEKEENENKNEDEDEDNEKPKRKNKTKKSKNIKTEDLNDKVIRKKKDKRKNSEHKEKKEVITDINNNNIIINKIKAKSHSKINDKLKNKIYLKAKEKIYNLFCSRRLKKENSEYLENVDTDIIDSKIKEDNMDNFIKKVKKIKYKGYKYKLTEDDYFERNGIKYKTILNSEDAAIKVCEEISDTINENKTWLDPEFGPQPNDRLNGLYGRTEWYTLDKILRSPKFFSDGIESNDVIQGNLGDCWFISALSVLATKDYLLRGEFSDEILVKKKIRKIDYIKLASGVYPPIFHSFRKKGIFCFRFYKNFKWRYVLVDNRLPCRPIGHVKQTPQLLYAKCRDINEFWVPMIEKAFAKLHGSYKAIESGFINEGLVDLTGMCADKILIKRNIMKIKEKADELWEILKKYSELTFDFNENDTDKKKKKKIDKYYTRNKTMMGCSVKWNMKDENTRLRLDNSSYEKEVILDNNHTGILVNHAYAILDIFEIPKPRGKKRKTSRLLRIRNPWGDKKEWKGKWCDGSIETIKNKERIEEKLNKKYKGTHEKINLSQEDGTFLMCFSDFREIYNIIYICKNFPPNYIGVRIYSIWNNNKGKLPDINKDDENLLEYPQYYLEKKKDGIVYISLIQKDGRIDKGETSSFPSYRDVTLLCIFKIPSKQSINNFKNMLNYSASQYRENILEKNLPKGLYIIIPFSKHNGDFCLELHFEDEIINKNYDLKRENKIECLKNNIIEQLSGNKTNWEISTEYIQDYNKSISIKKNNFIIQKFEEIIKDEDDFIYPNTDGEESSFNRGGNNNDDLDYDVF